MATFLAGKEEEARDSRAHRETWQRLKSKQKEMDVKVLVVYKYRGFVWINVYLLGQRDGREVIQGVLEMQWIRWIRMNCPFNLEREGESYETMC